MAAPTMLDPGDDRDALIARCLEEIERDGPAALERLCRAYPAHAEHLRQVVARLHGAGLLGTPAASAPALPSRLGRYRLLQRLGEGGMGVVYLAEQEALGRRVALKLIRPDLLHLEGARARLLREVEVPARLSHPGIVAVHDFGEEDGVPFFSMEWLRGCTLAEIVHDLHGRDPGSLRARDALDRAARRAGEAPRPAPLTGELAASWEGSYLQGCLRIALRAAQALAHAHGQGVVHRDVKPSNVMLTPEGRVVLLDFGLAQHRGSTRITRTGMALGSLAYMAPEQVCGQAAEARTDVYALGVTLYELLALQPAFPGDDPHDVAARIVEGARPALRSVAPGVPRDVETVVHKALERDRAQRYASAADFAADLGNLLELRPIAARRPGAFTRVRRYAQRHRARSTAIVLAAALAVGMPAAWYWAAERAHEADARASAAFHEVERFAVQLQRRLGEEELASLPGGAQAKRQLVADVLAQYERLRSLRPEDDPLVLRSADVHRRLGKLLHQLAAYPEALEALQRSAQQAGGLRGRVAAAIEVELSAYNGILALHLTLDQHAEAQAAGARALAAHAACPEPRPAAVTEQHTDTLNYLARLAERQKDSATCRRYLDQAIDELRAHTTADPSPRLLVQLGYLQCERGRVSQAAGDRRGARADFEAGMTLLRAAERRLPGDDLVQGRIASVALAYGILLLREGELDAAEDVLTVARAVFEARRRNNPDHVSPLSSLGAALHNLAMLAHRRGQLESAETLVEEALALQKEALARNSRDVQYRTYVGNHSLFLAQMRIEQGKHEGLDELLGVVPEFRGDGIDCVYAARLWFQRAAAAANDEKLDPAARAAAREHSVAAAFAMLDAAVARGYTDAQFLTSDRVFAEWAQDPRLAALLDGLARK